MKKVVIVGRGTAGGLGAMHLNTYLDRSKFEVEWKFDSSIPTQPVGEGTDLTMPLILHNCSDFDQGSLATLLGGCVKTGLKKTGWGDGHMFHHGFTGGAVGYHFQANMLQDYGFNYLKSKVKIDDSHVTSNEDIDADFVLDCSGRPKNLEEGFVTADNIVVNTAKVWQCPWDYPRFTHTLTLARPYGWVFGIPLSNRLSIGYLYNRNFATLDMIEDDIKEVFSEYNIKPSVDGNYIEFPSYYREENFNGRVGYSGNSSFFLEPIEATSTTVMDHCNRGMYDSIMGNTPISTLNANYTDILSHTQTLIMFNYYGGSAWDNDFWKYAEASAENRMHSIKNDDLFQKLMHQSLEMVGTNNPVPVEGEEVLHSPWQQSNYALHLEHLGVEGKMRTLLSST